MPVGFSGAGRTVVRKKKQCPDSSSRSTVIEKG